MTTAPLDERIRALVPEDRIEALRAAREGLADDPYRPLYHFSPPTGWMNDPNGLCRWRGLYHLFYQCVPEGRDRIHWGHAVSADLLHWRDLPPAFGPDGEKHCFSGQTLVESDRVIAIYHGVEAGNCIATASDPLLLAWQKHPANPVIPIVPVDDAGNPYRIFDPCIWKEDDGYYALSGTYKDGDFRADCRNVDHLFRSPDLAEWEHLGALIEGGFHTEPGEDGAVPNFWPIGRGKHMLLFFSHKRAAQYYVGHYDRAAHRLIPDYHGRMNYGPISKGSLHAPSATVTPDGRFLAIFNVKEGKEPAGWHDVMSLPRRLSLDEDCALRIEPAAEMELLRGHHTHLDGTEIPANGEIEVEGFGGKSIEIEAVLEPGAAREVGLCVLRSPDGAEQTRISLLRDTHGEGEHSLQIDISRASLRADVLARPNEVGPLSLREGEPLRLRVFVDRSIVEVFANGRQCLTLRAYPDREDSRGVALFARGGAAGPVTLDAWQMRSTWPELRHFEDG